jgi:hypothetical protein
MALLNSSRKLSLDLQGILFWCLICLIFPLSYGTIGGLSLFKGFLFLLVSACAGEILLGGLPFVSRIPRLLRTGFLMMTGTYLLFFIFALLPYPAVFYILLGIVVVLLFLIGKFSWSFDRISLAAVVPVCILLIYTTDLRLAASPVFINVPGDYFYYNILVISLSKTLSINNALFHTGIPMNYQSLTFFSPAALCYATGIPAHVALHGIFSPLMKVLSFSMLSASVVHLCRFVKGEESSAPWSWKYYAAASAALLLIAPLHPLYLAKLDVKNFIFLGEGYLLPMGVMGFALAIILFGVMNFFFFSDEKKSYPEIIIFVVFLSSVAAIKTAMFFPLLAFYGIYSLIRLIKNRGDRSIIYVFLALAGGVLVMNIFFGNAGGMIKNSLTLHEGYFPIFLSQSIQKFHRSPTTVNILLFFGFVLLMWMGLKTLLFSSAFFSKQPFLSRMWPIIIAALGCALISFLPGFLIKILMVDEKGNILQNDTFDTGQFSRAGLFICTAIAAMSLLLLWGTQTGIKKRLFQATVLVWFVLAFASFFKGLREAQAPYGGDGKWEAQVEADFHKSNPRLMGMLSDFQYSGQVLMAKEIYPWWTCSKRGADHGYVCTLKSNYRNEWIEELLNDSLSRSSKSEIIQKMKQEGVDVLVSTPVNKAKFEQLVKDSLITRPDNLMWIYKIK